MGFGKSMNSDVMRMNEPRSAGGDRHRRNAHRTRLQALIASVCIALVGGCALPAHYPDPLAGWSLIGRITWNPPKTPGERPPPVSDRIRRDYEDYIHKLPLIKGYWSSPSSESKYINGVEFFGDQSGKHAVRISIARDGAFREHVLVYDRTDKRIKVIKYVSGHYMS
jgi:hypothetical protein